MSSSRGAGNDLFFPVIALKAKGIAQRFIKGGGGGGEGRLSIRKRHFTEQVVGTRSI